MSSNGMLVGYFCPKNMEMLITEYGAVHLTVEAYSKLSRKSMIGLKARLLLGPKGSTSRVKFMNYRMEVLAEEVLEDWIRLDTFPEKSEIMRKGIRKYFQDLAENS